MNDYSISIVQVPPRAIAAVCGRAVVGEVGKVFRQYLDQVYATPGLDLDGQNIFVYYPVEGEPNTMDVDFGVGVKTPFEPKVNVVYTMVPTGRAARTTHWGDYSGLPAANQALDAWVREHGMELAGPRMEVYGHWTDDVTRLQTDVYCLIK